MNVHQCGSAGERLFWIDGFLPEAKCTKILDELQFAFWFPSTVTRKYGSDLRSVSSDARVSFTTVEEWFTPQLMQIVGGIQQTLVPLVPGIGDCAEAWQATRYHRGDRFDYHYDCGSWAEDNRGERVYTVVLYLNTPRSGGSTHFPSLNIDVKATQGRLLVWKNLTPEGDRDLDMLHSSTPILAGRKTILVTWVRQKDLAKEKSSEIEKRRYPRRKNHKTIRRSDRLARQS